MVLSIGMKIQALPLMPLMLLSCSSSLVLSGGNGQPWILKLLPRSHLRQILFRKRLDFPVTIGIFPLLSHQLAS